MCGPTLYLVHGRAKPVLHGLNSTECNLFHHGEARYRVGWCPRILLSWFRARNSAWGTNGYEQSLIGSESSGSKGLGRGQILGLRVIKIRKLPGFSDPFKTPFIFLEINRVSRFLILRIRYSWSSKWAKPLNLGLIDICSNMLIGQSGPNWVNREHRINLFLIFHIMWYTDMYKSL